MYLQNFSSSFLNIYLPKRKVCFPTIGFSGGELAVKLLWCKISKLNPVDHTSSELKGHPIMAPPPGNSRPYKGVLNHLSSLNWIWNMLKWSLQNRRYRDINYHAHKTHEPKHQNSSPYAQWGKTPVALHYHGFVDIQLRPQRSEKLGGSSQNLRFSCWDHIHF